MAKLKLNGTARWIIVGLAFCGIIWNAFELHYNTKKNTAILQNDVVHLAADMTEIKTDIKAINQYLLERTNQ